MSVLKKTRASQAVQSAEFVWNFSDTMLDTSGASKDFGAADLTARAFDVIGLPMGAVVVGGALVVETTFDTAGYDVYVGDSGVTNRYLASTDVKTAGITALVPTGFVNSSGLPIRITVATDDVCTAGKARLRVDFIVQGKANEVTAGGPY